MIRATPDKHHGHEFNLAVPVGVSRVGRFLRNLEADHRYREVMKSLTEYRELTNMALLPLTRPMKARKPASSRLKKVTSSSVWFPHPAQSGYPDRLKYDVA